VKITSLLLIKIRLGDRLDVIASLLLGFEERDGSTQKTHPFKSPVHCNFLR